MALTDTVADQRARPRPGPRTASSAGRRFRRDRYLLLLALPGALYFLVFHYLALAGNVIAFQDYVPFLGFSGSEWVGWANFTKAFSDPAVWIAVRNTLQIFVLQLTLFFPLPIALAILLHSITYRRLQSLMQSLLYLPHFLSWVIIVALFQQVLGSTGLMNQWLGRADLGLIDVIGNPAAFKPLVVAQLIWKDCGWSMIIFLAAIHRVDEQLYEAAAIDGAGYLRRLWHVTLPSMRPIILLMLILKMGDVLTVGFEQLYLQRSAVGPATAEVLDTFVYFSGVVDGNWGYATAVGLMKGVIAALLVFGANKLAHKLGEDGILR